MENITRTVYGSYLQTNMYLGLDHRIIPNTTLNEKFDIQSGVLPPAGQNPAVRYYAIGNGGHRMAVGADGIPYPEPIQHRATDAALFNHLPFVLRDPTNDLTPTERARYALRKEETYQGRRWIAYYLKRMVLDSVVPGMEYTTVNSGVPTTVPFTPDSSHLSPVPPQLNPNGVNVVTGDYVSSTAKVDLKLTAAEVAEILNVAKVIYDDERYAIVSEIALCSGVNKPVPVPGPGSATFNFNEAIGVQVCSHFAAFYPMKYNLNGVDLLLDVGATEPMFALQSGSSLAP